MMHSEISTKTPTRVVHCHKEPFDVYCGRPSKWSNPFLIGKDGTRKEVIEKYKNFVTACPQLLEDLDELEGKTLGCWCYPKPCHCDVLVELIEKRRMEKLFTK